MEKARSRLWGEVSQARGRTKAPEEGLGLGGKRAGARRAGGGNLVRETDRQLRAFRRSLAFTVGKRCSAARFGAEAVLPAAVGEGPGQRWGCGGQSGGRRPGRRLCSSSQHNSGTGSEKWLDSECVLKLEQKALGTRSAEAQDISRTLRRHHQPTGRARGAAGYGGASGG